LELELHHKCVLITGAGRGIGQTIAVEFAREGAAVAVNDIDQESTMKTIKMIQSAGGKGIAAPFDIADSDSVYSGVKAVENALGQIDVLVNNAAILAPKLFVESTIEDWDKEIKVILYGALNCTRAVIDGMMERTDGKIVNISSDAARVGQARDSYYGAAKAGVIAFSKSLAKEMGRYNININCVSPGATDSPMRAEVERLAREKLGDDRFAERQRKILKLYPLGRIGKPEDIAKMVLFLSSVVSQNITGQVISVNGGFSMPG
jgi:NAD(P)-dependent dehydrogenase (short-subunit alcohol dehydrogenase family)